MAYQPIEDYGIVGNLRTVALIGKTGNIDWFCFPHFDSPSIFAAILDDQKGGSFRLYPKTGDVNRKQLYWPDSNVLITRFLSNEGVGEITDYMPVGVPRNDDGYHGLIRRLRVVRGTMAFRMERFPAFNYGRDSHTIEIVEGGAKLYSAGLQMALATNVPLRLEGTGLTSDFVLEEGRSASFELHALKDPNKIGLSEGQCQHLLEQTVEYWRRWLGKSTYTG